MTASICIRASEEPPSDGHERTSQAGVAIVQRHQRPAPGNPQWFPTRADAVRMDLDGTPTHLTITRVKQSELGRAGGP